MKNSKTKQTKSTKDDLVREMASMHLGVAAYSISAKELSNYCKEMVDWRMKNNGTGLYETDGETFKEDFANIISKYIDIARLESLSEIIGEDAFKLTGEEIDNLQQEMRGLFQNSPSENLEADLDALYSKYKK
jgi:hypothetical protein